MKNNDLKKYITGKTAVFIDAANIELSAKDRGWRVDYRKLYEWLKNIGNLVYCGFFTVRFNSKEHDAFLTFLKKTGYKLTTKSLKLIKSRNTKGHVRKANFDVEITVESMKLMDSYDSYILFSGDSDFDYLLKELKSRKKHVIVISMKYHIAKELIKRADIYIDLKKIKSTIERKNKKARLLQRAIDNNLV